MCGQEFATCPPVDGPDLRPGERHVSNIRQLRYAAKNVPRFHHWMAQIYGLECAMCSTSDGSDIHPECATCLAWDGADLRPGVHHVSNIGRLRCKARNAPRVYDRRAQIYDLHRNTCRQSNGVVGWSYDENGTEPCSTWHEPDGKDPTAWRTTCGTESDGSARDFTVLTGKRLRRIVSRAIPAASLGSKHKVPARWLREKVRI